MLCFFLNICVAWYKSSDMKVLTLKVVFFEEGGVTGVEMTVSNRRFDPVYISELWLIQEGVCASSPYMLNDHFQYLS